MDPLDPYRAVNLLIQQHGMDAAGHAAQRAIDMHVAGDEEGERAWVRVLDAIWDLQANRPGDGQSVH